MKNLKRFYDSKKPIGVYSISLYSGIYVMDILYGIEEYFITCSVNSGKRGRYTKNKVYCSKYGQYYIRKNGYRIYLSDIMRTNYPA